MPPPSDFTYCTSYWCVALKYTSDNMWCFNIITRISLHLHWWFLFEFLTIQPRIRYYNLLHAAPYTLVSYATSRVAHWTPLNSLEQSRISRFLVLISRQENIAAGDFGDIFLMGFWHDFPRSVQDGLSWLGTRRLLGKCWSKPHSQGLEVNSFFGLKEK